MDQALSEKLEMTGTDGDRMESTEESAKSQEVPEQSKDTLFTGLERDECNTRLLSPSQRAAQERKLVRKLDMRLLPTIVAIYIMNYIDRTAVTAARLQGLERDLHLTGTQYSVVLAILYAAYCSAQVPSNMILNRISKPAFYIGACAVLWGLTSALAGITHNFTGMVLCRLFIGFPEAAFYPGCFYLLSRWYTRKELGLRSGILSSGRIVADAFGSLMAAGVLRGMEGKMSIRAWRWLFYIEGSITILIGLQAMWILPDYPRTTSWLSPSEKHLAQVRLAEEAGEVDEDSDNDSAWKGLMLALKDYKVQLFALMAFTGILGSSFGIFFPTLTATLGFSTTITLLLVAPPWILSAILCVVNSLHADRTGDRFFHIIGWSFATIFGYVIAVSTMSLGGRYFSLFLMALGGAGAPLTLVWLSNSVPRPPSKRAASIAIVNGLGNIGNLAGSFVWKAEWGPNYHQSMYIGIACMALNICVAFGIRFILVRENARMDENECRALKGTDHRRIEAAARLEGTTLEEAVERRKGFRYLY